ncbi:hypothetical protein SeMB42_g07800, partial [Synchytrium endobioticum]
MSIADMMHQLLLGCVMIVNDSGWPADRVQVLSHIRCRLPGSCLGLAVAKDNGARGVATVGI